MAGGRNKKRNGPEWSVMIGWEAGEKAQQDLLGTVSSCCGLIEGLNGSSRSSFELILIFHHYEVDGGHGAAMIVREKT